MTRGRERLRRWRRRGFLTLGALLAAIVATLAGTRTGRFLVRAAWEEGHILARRRPIEALVADPTTDARTRDRLRLVLDARAFAVDTLRLVAGSSFTAYTDVGRDTLVLVLSAARRDRMEARRWWFPVVGSVPYKGFFDVDAARAEVARLQARGFDTYLRTSGAFSTLGWFDDPLLSTTLRYPPPDLANTVIHELTHERFYAPGQAVFNESFASFVGARGAERFFRARGDTAAVRATLARWEDDKALGAFWAALTASIDSAYATHPGARSADSLARVQARDTVYVRARRQLVDSIAPMLGRTARWAEAIQLDNAALLARRTYARDLPLFDAVLAREGELGRAIDRIVELARGRRDDPFGAVRDWLAGPFEPTP